jgi:hypothetical protein
MITDKTGLKDYADYLEMIKLFYKFHIHPASIFPEK